MIKKMVTAAPTATKTVATVTSESALVIIAIEEGPASNSNKTMASEIPTATEAVGAATTI